MVGGTIIDVSIEDQLVRLWCVDDHGDECAVRIEKSVYAAVVKAGDTCWWQNGKVMWTPKGSTVTDIMVFKKVGNSWDPRRTP